jgi:hypothetical protein
MSDLQIGLIALGALAILIILGINWWQDRRARTQMQARFPVGEHDALLKDATPPPFTEIQRREPNFGAQQAAAAAAVASAAAAAAGKKPERAEPVVGALDEDLNAGVLPVDETTLAPEVVQHDADEPDPACEAVIDVVFNEPVAGDELAPFTLGLRHAGHKPLRVFAETAGGSHHAAIRPDARYASLQVAVLLANRSGPLLSGEWAEALSRARVLADQFEGSVEAPKESTVFEHARQLDTVCAALDVQVGLTLMARNDRWSASDVLTAAHQVGFAPLYDGKLPWLDKQQRVRFTLTRGDNLSFESAANTTISQLNLLLDVPRSPADSTAFGQLAAVARRLAAVLNADVVDDGGRPLADGAVVAIDRQLLERVERLEKAGLEAGSVRARRVFG